MGRKIRVLPDLVGGAEVTEDVVTDALNDAFADGVGVDVGGVEAGAVEAAAQADLWRAELREGYTVESVAARHGVTAQTVRRHASFEVAGRSLLLGTEVHIAGMRGRWEFRGEIGHAKDGEQYAKFVHARTGRSRIFHTRLISAVHRPASPQRHSDA